VPIGGAEGVVTTIPPPPKEISELKVAIVCWASNTSILKIHEPSMEAELPKLSAYALDWALAGAIAANKTTANSKVGKTM
jgi:hypothetical protein